jgi:hypothetical protein
MTGETAMRHLRTLRLERKVYYTREKGHREVLWLPAKEETKNQAGEELLTREPRRRIDVGSCLILKDPHNQNLPEGKTCKDCVDFNNCKDAHGAESLDEICYFIPGSFQLRKTEE